MIITEIVNFNQLGICFFLIFNFISLSADLFFFFFDQISVDNFLDHSLYINLFFSSFFALKKLQAYYEGDRYATFEQYYRCYPVSFIDKVPSLTVISF